VLGRFLKGLSVISNLFIFSDLQVPFNL